MTDGAPSLDAALAARLVASQFPQWADLPIRPVAQSGWDNRTFRLGEEMSVRLPSAARYAPQVELEHRWLPELAARLPLPIPAPVARGAPGEGYPWPWSVRRWIEGETVLARPVGDLRRFVTDLAGFLAALQGIDARGGPEAGTRSFHRGGRLAVYDDQTRQALAALAGRIDIAAATAVWEAALSTAWDAAPVWVHGDIAAGNLLAREGRLSAVIDFGCMAVGDPACDLAIAWTLLDAEGRAAFRAALPLDAGTWARGRGWALWKALILASGVSSGLKAEVAVAWRVIDAVLADA